MGKKHDESKDIRLLSSIANFDYATKSIRVHKKTTIGNNRWGRIDYLCHYCGWRFVWDNQLTGRALIIDAGKAGDKNERNRNAKKAAKQPKLTNKKKR